MADPAPAAAPSAALDLPTIAAIGMVAYLLSNLVHEGLGHGGTCWLVGGRPLGLSSAWFDGDMTGLSAWAVRAEKAGGTLANLLCGLGLLAWLRTMRRPTAQLYYFVWLAMTVNLLQAGGYLMASPLLGFGDWKDFIAGLAPRFAWQLGLTALGVLISGAALSFGVRTLAPLLGGQLAERQRRARWLCVVPYVFAGALVFSIAALFNPGGKVFILTSAAAHLGGTAWLVWLPAWVKPAKATTPAEPLALSRHRGWLLAGLLAALVCIFVLGPAIYLPGARPAD